MCGLGDHEVRQLDRFFRAGVEEKAVFRNLGRQRCSHFLPVRKQFREGAWFQYRTGQNVGADLGALFHNADGDFALLLLGQLHDATGGGQTRGSGTNNHDVKFH